MELNKAKQILNKNGYVLKERFVNEDRMDENYNFYRNPYYQISRKKQEKSELIKKELIEKIMDATDEYDAEELKSKNIRELKIILNNL